MVTSIWALDFCLGNCLFFHKQTPFYCQPEYVGGYYKTTSNGINVLNIELNNSLLWTVIVQSLLLSANVFF